MALRNTIVKFSLVLLAILRILIKPLSNHFEVLELAVIDVSSLFKYFDAFSLQHATFKLSDKLITVVAYIFAISLHLVFNPTPLVKISILKYLFTFAMLLTIQKISFINVSLRVVEQLYSLGIHVFVIR